MQLLFGLRTTLRNEIIFYVYVTPFVQRRLRIFAFRIVTKRVIVVIIIINSGNNKSGDRNKSSKGKLKYCQPLSCVACLAATIHPRLVQIHVS
jgi:hypothetical protein